MATIAPARSDSPANPVQRITSPSIPSPGGTPSSSVRPSVDLPRNNAPSSSPSLQQNATLAGPASTTQRRNRAALRDYYNLKSKGASAAVHEHRDISRTASITSTASDSTIATTSTAVPETTTSSLTAHLDDPTFDTETFVSDLLKTASLRDILKTESALVSEIRTLDGERKALVYDNYSKLIKAVGTIAEMQKGMHKDKEQDIRASVLARQKGEQNPGLGGVALLGEKLDGLLKVVKEFSPGTADGERATQSVEARRKRTQKETVRWALDAPVRLQEMMDRGQREEAEREYISVTEVLENWKGVRGVEELRGKCAKVMENTKEETSASEQGDSG
ncbi:uncharacterized protein Z520_01413 [Fonsecaea multimorphosa CBS 102226]|uniref:Vacuolar protein sorting-associated protein 51 homolog n=1 Tax=Fonsecaea multimorphosa CBS 102226 TaxID=1442371 RepID=A0A0D2KAA6_9EURO|nr:uncharacterized protein Z520_01413 [Fonsecaea multimorphosa CBS 102226]KIY02948.1 hypothetical protein Z520_01413 [Fonsecaea multimorphosa CBS 102226]OAL30780.1 hypothetical protein AYO22_01400 [Fonsecaea multimorphosa]